MAAVLPFVIVSVIADVSFMSPFMMMAFAATAAMLPFIIFTEKDYKPSALYLKERLGGIKDTFKPLLVDVVARAGLSVAFAILLAILSKVGVFGQTASFSVATFVCMLLVVLTEAIAFDVQMTKKGEGRSKRWIKIIPAYAAMLLICGITTQDYFAASLFANGIGSYEFIFVPVYLLFYITLIPIINRFFSNRNK